MVGALFRAALAGNTIPTINFQKMMKSFAINGWHVSSHPRARSQFFTNSPPGSAASTLLMMTMTRKLNQEV